MSILEEFQAIDIRYRRKQAMDFKNTKSIYLVVKSVAKCIDFVFISSQYVISTLDLNGL